MAKNLSKKSTIKKVKVATPKKASAKKATAKKSAKKASPKKIISDKEREQRAANLIANSEKKIISKAKRPKKNATKAETMSLLEAIVEGMKERKAKNITILNLNEIENRVADYFVICDADSKTHVNSIADSVEETTIKLSNEKAHHSEGKQNGEWIIIDYINIVAHVFLKEFRDYYNIEGMWGDAKISFIEN